MELAGRWLCLCSNPSRLPWQRLPNVPPIPNGWVVSTGEAHSVKEFLEESFSIVGLNWKDYVEVDEKYLRPNEVKHLLGDSTKIRKELKWSPKVSFKELTKMMVESDLNLAEQEKVLLDKKLISKTWEG